MMGKRMDVRWMSPLLIAGLLIGCADTGNEDLNQQEAAGEEDVNVRVELTDEEIHKSSGVAYFNRMPMTRYMMQAEDAADQLQEWLVIDLRDLSDFEELTLPGARHASWSDLNEGITSLPKNKQILWVSDDGQVASMVMAITRIAGVDSYLLAGGLNAWEGETEAGTILLEQDLGEKDNVSEISHEEETMMARAQALVEKGMEEKLYLIAPDELDSRLDDMYIIDTRSETDYQASHLPGAHHHPVADLGLTMTDIPDDQPLLVYCYSGQTGAQAASVLRMAGFDAYTLKGGMGTWVDEEVETE